VAKSWWNLTGNHSNFQISPLLGYFFAKAAFFFLPVNRTINLAIFFSNFQGFTLVPWQKVGRIGLGFAGNHSNFQICLFVC